MIAFVIVVAAASSSGSRAQACRLAVRSVHTPRFRTPSVYWGPRRSNRHFVGYFLGVFRSNRRCAWAWYPRVGCFASVTSVLRLIMFISVTSDSAYSGAAMLARQSYIC